MTFSVLVLGPEPRRPGVKRSRFEPYRGEDEAKARAAFLASKVRLAYGNTVELWKLTGDDGQIIEKYPA